MNKIVDKFYKRRKYDGPDAIEIDGSKIQLEGQKQMAERKKPQTAPVVTQDEKDCNEPDKRMAELDTPDFDHVIRYIKVSNLPEVDQLKVAAEMNLIRLSVKPNLKKVVKGVPAGSDNFSLGTWLTWMQNVKASEKKAVAQIVQIHATCVAREE